MSAFTEKIQNILEYANSPELGTQDASMAWRCSPEEIKALASVGRSQTNWSMQILDGKTFQWVVISKPASHKKMQGALERTQKDALDHALHRSDIFETVPLSKADRHLMYIWCSAWGLSCEHGNVNRCKKSCTRRGALPTPTSKLCLRISLTPRSYRKLQSERKRRSPTQASANLGELQLNISRSSTFPFETPVLTKQQRHAMHRWAAENGCTHVSDGKKLSIGAPTKQHLCPTGDWVDCSADTWQAHEESLSRLLADGAALHTTCILDKKTRHRVHIWCAKHGAGHVTNNPGTDRSTMTLTFK